MSLNYYDEINFSKEFLSEYNKYSYDNFINFKLFLLDYIKLYTKNNDIEQNIFIINNYYISIINAIELFDYKFFGTINNYSELASIVLFHKLSYKLLNIIIDDYDSSNETDNDNDNDNDND